MTIYRLDAIRDRGTIVSLDFVPTAGNALGGRTIYVDHRMWRDMVDAETIYGELELIDRECEIHPVDRIEWKPAAD
ncbi:MAG: hypothetical protein IH609_11935 [Dehalococcoidia bacterium]|nr:hypothetical protein [Dehalococcoidia bacterium]